MRLWAISAVLVVSLAAASSAGGQQSSAIACTGPAGDPQTGTAAWSQREQENDYCGEQREVDTSNNPLFVARSSALEAAGGGMVQEDPFRDPAEWNGVRGRYQQISFTDSDGQTLPGAIFRPCDSSCHGTPPALGSYSPPYPGVIIVHGGLANQEMYLWGAEGLAEAGYMVMTFQIPEPDNGESSHHYPDTKDALDYFESRPGHPTKSG